MPDRPQDAREQVAAEAVQNLTIPAGSAPTEGPESAGMVEIPHKALVALVQGLQIELRAAIKGQGQAERERDEALAALAYGAETLRRAEQAETALRELVDTTPCAPHPGTGYCQTHAARPPCPHGEAQRHLAALAQPEETP